MRKRDTTKRCFICIELGHLAKNYMNTRRIEDEKKGKAENIRKQMRQQWIPKSSENAILRNNESTTQTLNWKANVTSARSMDINLQNARPRQ